LTHKNKIRFAKELVHSARIPLVLLAEEDGQVRAWNEHGEYLLPQDAAKIVGPSHPFFDEVVKDLVSLCHHPNAGTLTISGWRQDGKPFSFPFENGAHAGPGTNETNAFALIPAHIKPNFTERPYLRPGDLRELALKFLKKERPSISAQAGPTRVIRIMTYNVHGCVGVDGRLSPQRIARVIGRYAPDIVALQEVDMGRKRSGEVDQAHLIAKELEMNYHFYPSVQVEEQKYGNAILSRYPLELVQVGRLPGLDKIKLEPRGAMRVVVDIGGIRLQIINTHLAFYIPESRIQARHLVSQWINHPDCCAPTILCGDLNNTPQSVAWHALNEHLTDAQLLLEEHRPLATWFGYYPIGRIDHIFVSKGIKVFAVDVPRTQLDKVASDHLPLFADVEIQNCEAPYEIKLRG
jgi:endonuclease/exonuclease/phosphatase family metal-dependent hydrolase